MANGIQIKVIGDVARLQMFLDNTPRTWVEFNLTQLNALLRELEKADLSLKKKVLGKA